MAHLSAYISSVHKAAKAQTPCDSRSKESIILMSFFVATHVDTSFLYSVRSME